MSLERKLGLGLSSLFLAGLLSCGAEGSSANGCKNDNDCKGDRYCDESINQCVSNGTLPQNSADTAQQNPADIVQPIKLKTILDEEFDSSLGDKWISAGCPSNCPLAVEGEDYTINNGRLKNDSWIAYDLNHSLGEGKIVLEYKVRTGNADYIIHGLRGYSGSTRLMCYGGEDDGMVFGCGVSQGSGDNPDYSKDVDFALNPNEWHTLKVEADTSQAVFTADGQSQSLSTKELDSSAKLQVWLMEGEYDYLKIETE